MPSSLYDSTRQAWETIWDSASIEVELKAVKYPRSMATIRTYARYLPKDALILEAGSGLSAVVITLREMGFRVAGLDYAVNALQASRAYDPTLALLAGDVHALPMPDNSLGAYLSFGVLEHFEQGMGPALAEAYRVLKPGGVLVLTIPYPNVVQRLAAWRRGSRLIDEGFYESTYTRAALVQAVQAAGFTVMEALPTSHSFTLWGLSKWFRGPGYYETNRLAEVLGGILRVVLPWAFNYSTLVIARK
jgi:ubiquinone/menaquinone biosynthesis C-methylase UbiE